MRIVSILSALALASVPIIAPVACRNESAQSVLVGSVRLGKTTTTVTNGDTQHWTNVRITISNKFLCPPIDLVRAESSIDVALKNCATVDGDHFNTATMVVTNVVVRAIPGRDGGEGVAGFSPNTATGFVVP